MVSTTEVKVADSVGSVGVGKSGFLDGLEECISLSHKQKQKELNRVVFPKMGTLKTTHLAPVSPGACGQSLCLSSSAAQQVWAF